MRAPRHIPGNLLSEITPPHGGVMLYQVVTEKFFGVENHIAWKV